MFIESVMSSNHLILCCPLLLLPSIFLSIRVFSNELALHIRWPKYWSFSFSISPSNEYSGLISFRIDWLDLLVVQRTFKSLLQHHNLKASILQHSAFFMIQLSPWHSLSLYMRQIDVCPLGGFPSTETFRCSLSGAVIHWLPTAGCCHMPCQWQWLLSLEIPGAHREFLVKPETWHEGGTVKQKEQLHRVSKVPVFPLYCFLRFIFVLFLDTSPLVFTGMLNYTPLFDLVN